MGLFGKSNEKSPQDMVHDWCHRLRKEGYQLDRQIRNIQREEAKTKNMLKDSAKKGEGRSCHILAKEILNARKSTNRLNASKAHLSSVQLSMKHQLATLRIAGALQKSTDVMTSMQKLMSTPEMVSSMQELAKEMMKAGILEEMIDDTLDVSNEEGLEEDADSEIDKILFELTAGVLGKAPEAIVESLPAADSVGTSAGPSRVEAVEVEEDLSAMQARLEALRS